MSLSLCDMPLLSSIEAHAFTPLKNLISLRLSSNPKLSYIDEKAFDGMFSKENIEDANINEVYLSGNNLKVLSAGLLPWKSLQVIDLQRNSWNCDCNLQWFNQLKNVMPNNHMTFDWK